MEVSGCQSKKRLNTGTVAFGLAPRINAAGRLERAMMAVEMLTTDDALRAQQIALELDRCNARRQEIERRIQEEARAMIEASGGIADRRSIVLAGKGWHPGVIGIVAGRLADIYHRPTIILAQGDTVAQGSARSIAGFDLYEAIKDCAGPLLGFGGHAAAAGLKLAKDDVAAFARLFEDRCRDGLTPEHLERVTLIDAEVPLGALSLRVVEEMDRLEPYGVGNPKPLLLAGHLEVVGQPRIVGDQQNHVQLRVRQGNVVMKAIGWNMAERGKGLGPGTPCSLVFYPSINEWNNRREVQLEIKDFAIDAPAGSLGRQAAPAAIPTV
jgi:single-stranded-DNA-specific exonuclease